MARQSGYIVSLAWGQHSQLSRLWLNNCFQGTKQLVLSPQLSLYPHNVTLVGTRHWEATGKPPSDPALCFSALYLFLVTQDTYVSLQVRPTTKVNIEVHWNSLKYLLRSLYYWMEQNLQCSTWKPSTQNHDRHANSWLSTFLYGFRLRRGLLQTQSPNH